MWEPQRIEAEAYEFPAPTEAEGMDREELLELLRKFRYQNPYSIQSFNPNNTFTFRRPRSARWRQVYNDALIQGAA